MSTEVIPYAGTSREARGNRQDYRFVTVPHHGGTTVEVVSYSGQRKGSEGAMHWGTSNTENSEELAYRIEPARRSQQPAERQKKEKVLRRIDGFVMEDEGEEFKVVFVEGGQPIEYYMPSSPFRKAGITAPNQPFEMDEIEVEISGGRIVIGYSFSPLAKPADAFPDAIELNEERKRKLNAIFKKFGKAQN